MPPSRQNVCIFVSLIASKASNASKICPQLFALVVILYVHYLGQFFIKIEYIC